MTKPDLSPGEKPEPKEIRDFREQYAAALQHAHVSEEHTATQGWQDLYAANRDKIRKAQDALCDGLETLVNVLRQRLLAEDEEKNLGELKKSLGSLRESDEAFQRNVIEPIIAPMDECNTVIQTARSAARESERNAPLHTRGLSEAMETVIDTMPRVKFIVASGRLVVGTIGTN